MRRTIASLALALAAAGSVLGIGTAHADTDTWCEWTSPARISGTGQMLEDESPYEGACGGHLVSYSGDGVAVYSDGTATNGRVWYWADEDLTVCWHDAEGRWISAATPTYGEPCAW